MYDIDEICEKVNGVFSKKISLKINRISSLKSAKKNEISFFSHLKYFDDLKQSKASVFLVSNSLKNKVDSLDLNFIFVKDITIATNAIIDMFMSNNENYEINFKNEVAENFVKGKNCFIDSFVKINSNSKIGDNVKILSNCHIGKNVTIGDNSVIYSGVKIYDNSVIGENNIIHSNAVIGSDGFGFAFENKTLQKFITNSAKQINLVGMISDAGVHSDIKHIKALVEIINKVNPNTKIQLHAISDGRDVAEKSVEKYLEQLNILQNKFPQFFIGSLITFLSIVCKSHLLDSYKV